MILIVLISLIPTIAFWYVVTQNWSPLWSGITVTVLFAATYLNLSNLRGRSELKAWLGRLR